MARKGSNKSWGGCRHGLGCILLFSLVTNAYLIFLFHRIAGRDGGAPTGLGVPPPWEQQDNAGSGSGDSEDHDAPAIETGKKRLRGGEAAAEAEEEEPSSRTKQLSPEEKPLPKPDGWEKMGFYKMRKHFDCSGHDKKKPLPTLEHWQFLRERYREIVDDTQQFDDPVPPTDGYTFGDGGPPPYYAAHSTTRGRGLFASRAIKKGELVHNGEQSDILIPSGMAWRRFIFSLPRKKACDAIDWTWTQRTEKNGPLKLFTAMNISILLNGGNKRTWNVNPNSSTSSMFYATKDIKKGEELLTNYEIYDTVWHKVGLGSEDDDGSEEEEEGGDDDGSDEEEKNASENEDDDDAGDNGDGDAEEEEDASGSPPGKQVPAEEEPWPKPDGWKKMGFQDIRWHFDCRTYVRDETKPLPTLEDWKFLRDKYRQIVDDSVEFDDPVPPTDGYTFGDGGPPPYYAAHSKDGKSRGLFASRDIKKGELVHNGKQSDIVVHSGMAWRRFVFALPRKKACDVIHWTWTQKTESSGRWKLLMAMNISILLNGGSKDTWNVNPKSSTSSKMYALRDIQKGEELLTNYDIYPTVFHKVGLSIH